MAAPKPITRLISHVILDLDGTLLNTGDSELQSFLVLRFDLSKLNSEFSSLLTLFVPFGRLHRKSSAETISCKKWEKVG